MEKYRAAHIFRQPGRGCRTRPLVPEVELIAVAQHEQLGVSQPTFRLFGHEHQIGPRATLVHTAPDAQLARAVVRARDAAVTQPNHARVVATRARRVAVTSGPTRSLAGRAALHTPRPAAGE